MTPKWAHRVKSDDVENAPMSQLKNELAGVTAVLAVGAVAVFVGGVAFLVAVVLGNGPVVLAVPAAFLVAVSLAVLLGAYAVVDSGYFGASTGTGGGSDDDTTGGGKSTESDQQSADDANGSDLDVGDEAVGVG